MSPRPAYWWFPSAIVATIGVVAVLVGIKIGGSEVVDGVVIGVLALLVARVMFVRRASES